MSDDKTKTATADSKDQTKPMTAADAAKRVKRTVTELVDGKGEDGQPIKVARAKEVAVTAAEVLSSRDHGTHVVVVTKDGQKFSSAAE